MDDIKKQIETLLKKQQKTRHRKEHSEPHINTNYFEYVSNHSPKNEIRLRSHNHLKQHYQQQENLRLYKKLTQIRSRQKINDRSTQQEKMIQNVYQLNVASRRLQRKIREKQLEKNNNIFIERIVKIKTHASPHLAETIPLQNSRHRKKSSRSVMLPPILATEPI